METALQGFDAVLSPTVPIVAPPIADVAPAQGRDPQGEWPDEDSLLVWHMGPTQSRAGGRHWEQNAVLTVGSDAVPRLLLLR